MYIQLEDEFGDVVGKARRGQEKSLAQIGELMELAESEIAEIEAYRLTPSEVDIDRLAAALGLDAGKLRASANKSYFPLYPSGRQSEDAVVEVMVLGSDFLMNGYVVGCRDTRQAAIIDPGFEAERILKTVETLGLDVQMVLLTHGHSDHTGALSEVCQATGAPAYLAAGDTPLLGGLRTKIEGEITDGQKISVGNLEFEARSTSGHTPDGMTVVHEQFAFVGDALFAGSLGGTTSKAAYDTQLSAVRERIFSLDNRTTLYPGHGPATTVSEERLNNPFFREF